jgi:aryl-alcohol dehydrogenase-like predicted oxidoreductase
MNHRKLRNLDVSAIGMGCMGFSHGYGEIPSEEESIRLIRKAYDLGCTFFDTSEAYGTYANEELVGKALKPFRDKIILSTKFVPVFLPGQEISEGKLSRKGTRNAVEASLKRLQTDYIDLYYQHRVPLDSNVEEVAYWVGELIQEGKIRAWGQSQSTVEQITKANAVTPITAIQSEYSMMARQWENNVIPTCEELGIGFAAYAPLAGGFLSGKLSKDTQYNGDDIRRTITRYTKENVEANQPLIDLVKKYAAEKNATPAQISIAWVMHKNDFIVPIPGMRKDERVVENLGAADIELTAEEYSCINEELSKIKVYGDRKDEDIAKLGTIKF